MADKEIELEQQIAQLRQQKQQAFVADYQKLVDEHGCDFSARPYIDQDGRIRAAIEVVFTGAKQQ
jgi:hypothetical protein